MATPAGTRYVPDVTALRNLLTGADGPVYKDLVKKCIRVTTAAKVGCPVKTGRLRSSIRWQISAGPIGNVGTDVNYAAAVHNGSRAHDIFPKNGGVLAWKVGDTTFFAASVHHPGTKGVPFLTRALAALKV
jgi:hypothetical protein